MTELVQRIADPPAAARQIPEATAHRNPPSAKAVGIIPTVAGYGSIPLAHDHGGDKAKDRLGAAHEAGMHVDPSRAGVPHNDVVAAINDPIHPDGNSGS